MNSVSQTSNRMESLLVEDFAIAYRKVGFKTPSLRQAQGNAL
ncbi:hypothetical protein [Nostoc sp. NMS7]|nr:hypothetical protein [Nostoc sp. NMS7]